MKPEEEIESLKRMLERERKARKQTEQILEERSLKLYQTNQELIKTIASALKKPLFLPNIPKFFMKIILGEMHVILFESQRVDSKSIKSEGFHFKYCHLKAALENLL